MANQAEDKTFTWVIQSFSSIKAEIVYSDPFMIDGNRWRLRAYPKGDRRNNYLSIFLSVSDAKSLPHPWKRDTYFSFTIVNQVWKDRSIRRDGRRCYNQKRTVYGISHMLPFYQIHAKNRGFLVNGELKIIAEVITSEEINALQESDAEPNQLAKRLKREGSFSPIKKTLEINGFEVCISQIELVSHMFRKHPDMAAGVLFNDREKKTASMNVLISLIRTLCKSVQELSDENLMEADAALRMMKDSGFKVDWLESKLEEIQIKKEEHKKVVTWMQDMEEILESHRKKCADIEALLEEEKAKMLRESGTSLTFHDVV